MSGVLETCLGLIAILLPTAAATGDVTVWWWRSTAICALFLHIPTGLLLSPKVWGLKHITVIGYFIVGFLRAHKAILTLYDPVANLPDLWILLHMATLVRLVAYYISPWSSSDGGRSGDLLTDPLVYTFTVTVAGLVTLGFVYPPAFNLFALVVLAFAHAIWPSNISTKRIPTVSVAPTPIIQQETEQQPTTISSSSRARSKTRSKRKV